MKSVSKVFISGLVCSVFGLVCRTVNAERTEVFEKNWASYFKPGGPGYAAPRETVIKAIEILQEGGPKSGLSIDLGAGNGRDTVAMLEAGWEVLAIDGSEDALRMLQERAGIHRSRLTTQASFFERMVLPKAVFINAAYSLPFAEEKYFPMVWAKIIDSLQPGGLFSGQFFGPEDKGDVEVKSRHSEKEIREVLLKDFEILDFTERKESGKYMSGTKFWHVYNVVARKKNIDAEF